MNWQDFHFIRPWWLLMLLPVLAGLARLWWRRASDSAWRGVVSPELLPHLLLEEALRRPRWPLMLVFAGFVLAILAVAGPTWERLPQPVFSNQSSLVIALDLSRSMDARDIKPSRLQSARFKVEDILHLRKEGQTALIAFAGAAFTVSPLTDDARTIISQLPALTTDIMPVQGSNTAGAIRLATELLQQARQPAAYGATKREKRGAAPRPTACWTWTPTWTSPTCSTSISTAVTGMDRPPMRWSPSTG